MKISRYIRDRSGAVAIVTAMVMPVLLGMGSLGIEVSHWYLGQRLMQGAADAAVISAGAEYVMQYNSGNPNSTTYRTVGQHYAALNGFNIPITNVCLIDPNGVDGCSVVETLDRRPIGCGVPPCVVVEIAQNTFQWPTTRASVEPSNRAGRVQAIPTPVLLARSVASVRSQLITTNSSDCILALANDTQAILLHGQGDIQAKCGVAIDGGLDQNRGTPVVGGITFNGNGTAVNINKLNVAAATASCPDNGTHCQQFGSTVPLPPSAVTTNKATLDPYLPQVTALFQTIPADVSAIAVKAAGTGYTKNASCTFTVMGGTYYSATSSPAIFTATTDKNGEINGVGSISDPGAYTPTGFPTGNVLATSTNCGAGSGATFTLTQGCWPWDGVMTLPGRKYCSINLKGSGTTNFRAGSYWIDGSGQCGGFCVSSNNATVTSDPAGVTFFLTNVANGGSATPYATVAITSGSVSLCAPNTSCGTSCTATVSTSCMLFIQNPVATPSSGNGNPSSTISSFAGNGSRTLAGLIYLPKQTFQETGNGPIEGCVAVVAKYFDIGGTPIFSDGCLPGNGIGSTTVTTTLSLPHLSQ
jgi:hypothetical protein